MSIAWCSSSIKEGDIRKYAYMYANLWKKGYGKDKFEMNVIG